MLKFEVSQGMRSTLAAPQVLDVVIALFGLSLQVLPNLNATDIEEIRQIEGIEQIEDIEQRKLCGSVTL